jgi:hypothetical protein
MPTAVDMDDSRVVRGNTKTVPQANQLIAHTRFNPSVETQAITVVMRQHLVPSLIQDTARGYMQAIPPLLNVAGESSPLRCAASAIALAVWSKQPGNGHLRPYAVRAYGRGLKSTQRAIADLDKATGDDMILAVLLFATYETMNPSARSLAAWAGHIDGAVALVKFRGPSIFESARSKLLRHTVHFHMISRALQTGTPIPELPGPRGWIGGMREEGFEQFYLVEHSIALHGMHNAAKVVTAAKKPIDAKAEIEQILQASVGILEGFERWEQHLQTMWKPRLVAMAYDPIDGRHDVDKVEVWPGPVHVYGDVHIVAIRNNNRVSQILCASLILSCIDWLIGPSMDHLQHQYSRLWNATHCRLQNAVNGICLSVPFCFWGQNIAARMRAVDLDTGESDYPIWIRRQLTSIQHQERPGATSWSGRCMQLQQRKGSRICRVGGCEGG